MCSAKNGATRGLVDASRLDAHLVYQGHGSRFLERSPLHSFAKKTEASPSEYEKGDWNTEFVLGTHKTVLDYVNAPYRVHTPKAIQ